MQQLCAIGGVQKIGEKMSKTNFMDLTGKVAVVTGGSRGIGRAICERLAELGADIAIVCIGDDTVAAEAVAAVGKYKRKARFYRCDVSDFEACKNTIEDIAKDMGSVDILVNNAGITKDMLIIQMKESDYDAVMDINLKGAFNMAKHVVAKMIRQRSGKIINISSTSGLDGNIGQANYSAAKAGMIGLTKSLAKEVASRGITVNAVAPGFIDTDMTKGLKSDLKDKVVQFIPLGRFGAPSDIANMVGYLASPAADYITAQVLRVDGGLMV